MPDSGLISAKEYLDQKSTSESPSTNTNQGGVIRQLQKLDEDGLDTTSKFYAERKKLLQSEPYYYANKLKSDYDRIKADIDKDGHISKEEYESYVIKKVDGEPQEITSSVAPKDNAINIDWTVVTSVSIVCITVLLTILILKLNPRNKKA
ncbi:hypothetical protein [Gorillibacterium sp. sgz5001074]|uniref:hypothetical protein n=1 Tax=Gorillibacterium sp. sgz5001074 TaxID=3446695 RepID=UPI003F67994E